VLSPNGQLLLSIDVEGRALLVVRPRRVLLHHFTFKAPVGAAAFSPDGKYLAVGVGKLLQVGLGAVWSWSGDVVGLESSRDVVARSRVPFSNFALLHALIGSRDCTAAVRRESIL
jgi:hypothetical protein